MTSKQANALHTRNRLITAAINTIGSQGIAALTLDTVAKEAGVSKGGLLHHFSSKEALLEAILRQLFADFEERVQQHYHNESPTPGRWLRAYVRATFDDAPLPLEVAAMLLGAITENRALLRLIQDDFVHWQQRLLSDGIHKARASIIRQAADAYWTERLLGVAPEHQADRLEVMNELLQLAEG
jgi:AcrR family transcriptional regulator